MGKTKILLVEDDAAINKLITDYMTAHGFEVTSFLDAPEALDHVQMRGLPHIALIDLQLPSMHGFELSNRLNSDTETVVQGLKKYAEDFIVKPFEMRELEARTAVVLARMPSLDYASEPIIRIDDGLNIDFAHNRIVVNSKPYGLTPTESILLHVLLRNAGRVVENRMLIARVWPSEEVYEDTLRVHMHRLRRKLEADSHHPHYIRTERGVGYMFTVRPPEGIALEGEEQLVEE